MPITDVDCLLRVGGRRKPRLSGRALDIPGPASLTELGRPSKDHQGGDRPERKRCCKSLQHGPDRRVACRTSPVEGDRRRQTQARGTRLPSWSPCRLVWRRQGCVQKELRGDRLGERRGTGHRTGKLREARRQYCQPELQQLARLVNGSFPARACRIEP